MGTVPVELRIGLVAHAAAGTCIGLYAFCVMSEAAFGARHRLAVVILGVVWTAVWIVVKGCVAIPPRESQAAPGWGWKIAAGVIVALQMLSLAAFRAGDLGCLEAWS